MELRELRYFVAVAEELSFSRAAERLHITQQSLSSALARSEASLGSKLLNRTTRKVELTPSGRALLAAAPSVLTAADDALAAARAASPALRQAALRIRLGLDSAHLVEPLLVAFQSANPQIELNVVTGVDTENLAAVREGRADASFAWALDSQPGDLVRQWIGEDECVVAMPAGHELASLSSIPRGDVAQREVVMFAREHVPAVWDLIAGALDLDRDRLHELPVNGQETMLDVAMRLGAICPVSSGLVPRLSAGRSGVEVRRLDPPLAIPLHLAWRSPPQPAVHALTAMIRRIPDED